MTDADNKRKRRVFESVFPREFDFEGMLLQQAQATVEGLRQFMSWMQGDGSEDPGALAAMEDQVDEMRYNMEGKLIEAFSTPFDRQEIYGLSRQMDYILNFAVETAREVHAFKIRPDEPIIIMSRSLLEGMESLLVGIEMVVNKKGDFEAMVRRTRVSMHAIDDEYIEALARLLEEPDLRMVMKRREVYHHMRDAGRALRTTVDVLHRMKVDIF
jgi:uncharacterized protein Yka (UPF0111/DUF47 family)